MTTDTAVGRPERRGPTLARTISPRLLTLFIVGDILGAGVYAVLGEVATEAGGAIWASFLVAFTLAFLTAASYTELVTRYPRAAGAALYVHRAFRRPFLTFLVSFGVVMSGVTSASTSARAFGGDYLGQFFSAPVVPIALAFIVVLELLNLFGITESVRVNVVLTAIEILGLVVIVVTGVGAILEGSADAGNLAAFPADTSVPFAIVGGASLAFFSMIGFEDSVNVAEEVKDPRRAYPRAMFTGLGIVSAVYLLVALIGVAVVEPGDLAGSSGPLLEVVRAGPLPVPLRLFAVIALLAVTNTALINLIMASRLTYGMANEGVLPRVLGRVSRTRRTPWSAIAFTGLIPFVLVPLGDLGTLADVTVLFLLVVFTLVNVAVLVLRRVPATDEPAPEGPPFRVPTWVPVAGAVTCVGLLTQQEPRIWLFAGGLLALGVLLWLVNRLLVGRIDEIDAERLGE